MYLKHCLHYVIFIIILNITPISHAEVVLDGTLGRGGALSGSNYLIGADLGQQHGDNLFHSFQSFNLQSLESATFSGSEGIHNIISRVTGGNPSHIDGLLRSTIPNADLYFLNPAGVIFGSNARLDIPASLYVSTADYLKLEDGGHFDVAQPDKSLLTVASPAAFGFLDASSGKIAINGSQLLMQRNNPLVQGNTLALIGGDINIQNGVLRSSNGNIHLLSVASRGEAFINTNTFTFPESTFAKFGTITIADSTQGEANFFRRIGNLDVSGLGGGEIFIRAGQLFMDNGYLFADTYGNTDGRGITIQVTDELALKNTSRITTDTAQPFLIPATGNAGKIHLTANQISLTEGSQIASSTKTPGNAGNITISATEKLYIAGRDTLGLTYYTNYSGILSNTLSQGNGRNITIMAAELLMDKGGEIRADTDGYGDAGNVSLQVERLTLQNAAIIDVSAGSQFPQEMGQAGNLIVQADESILISGIGKVWARVSLVDKPDQVRLIPHLQRSGLLSNTFNRGQGGGIDISTPLLTIQNHGHIESGSQSEGAGGNLRLKVEQLNLMQGGFIAATSLGNGNAGDIELTTKHLQLHQGGITTYAKQAGGGNIRITADKRVHFLNSQVEAKAAGLTSDDSGGNIIVSQPNFFILQDSTMDASAIGGDGGNITMTAKNFVRSADSPLNVTSKLGTPGQLQINTEVNLIDNFTMLPYQFETVTLSMDRCAGVFRQDVSTFRIISRDGLPASPEDLKH
jgi:filamentous hemagglutinin family protein